MRGSVLGVLRRLSLMRLLLLAVAALCVVLAPAVASDSVERFRLRPSIERLAERELRASPIGVLFSSILDDDYEDSSHPGETRDRSIFSSSEDDGRQHSRKFADDFGDVANKANDFLEELISFIGGRRRGASKNGRKGSVSDHKAVAALTLGEHVCVRETEVPLPFEGAASRCANLRRATRCVSGTSNGTLLRIVECCDGYSTEDIRNGCSLDSSLKKLSDLLEREGACLNGFEITQTTVLLTPNKFCSSASNSTVNVGDYLLDGVLHDYELLEGQAIRTKSARSVIVEGSGDSTKPALLNCVELGSEEVAKNGVIFYLKDPLNVSQDNLIETLANRGEFGVFLDVLGDELNELLSSSSIFTVFAFTDSAFASLSTSLQSRIQQRRGCAKDIIKDHVYKGMHCSSRLVGYLSSLNDHSFKASKEIVNGTLFIRIGNARVVEGDQIAANGVIHVIDDVILSEKFVDWREYLAINEEDFLKLVDEVVSPDVEPAAVFVPPKGSFAKLDDKKSFVENHIAVRRSAISNSSIKTASGSKIPSCIDPSGESWFGCSTLRKPPFNLCGTSVYLIRKPLPVVRENLMELLANRSDLSSFHEFFANSTIVSVVDFENDGLYTLFVPSDDSFSKNQLRTLRQNATLSESFVRRHIFQGFLCSVNLIGRRGWGTPKVLKNIQNEYYAGKAEDGKIIVGDSVVQEETVATNGIVHVVETPLKTPYPQRSANAFSTLLDIFD